METLLVGLIVGLAVVWMVRFIYKSTKGSDSCGCGCSSCDTAVDCSDKEKTDFKLRAG